MDEAFRKALALSKVVGESARKISEAAAKAMKGISPEDLKEAQEIVNRQRAARANPDNPKSKKWLAAISDRTPREASQFWRYLPDPLKKRGRPRGSGKAHLVDELEKDIRRTGESPTSAARKITGEDSYTKPRADYLVRQRKNRSRKK